MTRTLLALGFALTMAAGTVPAYASNGWAPGHLYAGSGNEQDQDKGQDQGKGQGQDEGKDQGQDQDKGQGQDQDQGKDQGQDQEDKGGKLIAGSGNEQDQDKGQGQDEGKDQGQDQGQDQDQGKDQGQEDKGGKLIAGSGNEQDQDKGQGQDQDQGKDQGQDQDQGKDQGQDQGKGQGQDMLAAIVYLDSVAANDAEMLRPRRHTTACFARNATGRTFRATMRGNLNRRRMNMLQRRAVNACRASSNFFLKRTCRALGCRVTR